MSKSDTSPAPDPANALHTRAGAADIDDAALRALMHEDVPFGDLTTAALGLSRQPAQATFTARGPMVVCGIEEAARLFELSGAAARIAAGSGSAAQPGDLLLTVHGDVSGVLAAWKTAQTLTEALSGIATAAQRIVGTLRDAGYDLPLACTRKNFPGTRALAAKAVRCGGAVMHRLGLSETLLVFPEHRAFLPAAQHAQAIETLRRRQPEKRVVVEVGTLDEALALAHAGADVLQLERFTPQQLRELRTTLASLGLHPLLAPAGGVTLANAVDYARAGADFLVSSAPYFAPPADIQVRIQPRDAGPAG